MPKYLRIAVTALSLAACVLMIALWVRSYWQPDIMRHHRASGRYEVASVNGLVVFSRNVDPLGTGELPFGLGDNSSIASGRVDFIIYARETTFGSNSYHDGLVTALVLPHWFLSLLSAAIALTTWLPGRFSLRTLLIATTLVAVGLGVIVTAVRFYPTN